MNTPAKSLIFVLFFLASCFTLNAQPADTIVVRVGKESKVIFSIKDKQDLETLKHYNFQALMDDMLKKLEMRDTSTLPKAASGYLKDSTTQLSTDQKPEEPWVRDQPRKDDWRDWNDDYRSERRRTKYSRRAYHSFNIDLGMNNYLENGSFPDGANQLYTVKPWGSWYVALNSTLRTRVAGKFYIEWGAGVSWYNFKFTNFKVGITKDDSGVIFYENPNAVEFTKSKLTVAYVNLSMVPMFDFGGYSRKPMVFNGDRLNFDRRGSFRFGVGPYVGYRLDSYTKQVWEENGDKYKSHDHDSYYLNNIRYGLRAQIGFRDTDIFFNYDLNDLFIEDKGPRLHAFSFGITL